MHLGKTFDFSGGKCFVMMKMNLKGKQSLVLRNRSALK